MDVLVSGWVTESEGVCQVTVVRLLVRCVEWLRLVGLVIKMVVGSEWKPDD